MYMSILVERPRSAAPHSTIRCIAYLAAALMPQQMRPRPLHCLLLQRHWRHLLRGRRLLPHPPQALFALRLQRSAPWKEQQTWLKLTCRCLKTVMHFAAGMQRTESSAVTSVSTTASAPQPPSPKMLSHTLLCRLHGRRDDRGHMSLAIDHLHGNKQPAHCESVVTGTCMVEQVR